MHIHNIVFNLDCQWFFKSLQCEKIYFFIIPIVHAPLTELSDLKNHYLRISDRLQPIKKLVCQSLNNKYILSKLYIFDSYQLLKTIAVVTRTYKKIYVIFDMCQRLVIILVCDHCVNICGRLQHLFYIRLFLTFIDIKTFLTAYFSHYAIFWSRQWLQFWLSKNLFCSFNSSGRL